MLPLIHVFKYPVAMYGLCIVLGLAGGIFIAVMLGKKKELLSEDIIFASFYGTIGIIVGGKMLYLLIEFPQILQVLKSVDFREIIMPYITGGFVFYGGLIGGCIMIYVYCKKFKCSPSNIFSVLIPAMPFIHAIGRIGCLCAGCCYGTPYDGIGNITFSNAIAAPNGISLFPTQLIEMLLNLIICIQLVIYSRRNISTTKLLGIYLAEYSVMRFLLEFFRGDIVRGFLFHLSTSQWISVLLFVTAILIIKFPKFKYFLS